MARTATKPVRSGTLVRLTTRSGLTRTTADTMMTTAATGETARMRFDVHYIGSATMIGSIPAFSAICGMSSMKL